MTANFKILMYICKNKECVQLYDIVLWVIIFLATKFLRYASFYFLNSKGPLNLSPVNLVISFPLVLKHFPFISLYAFLVYFFLVNMPDL